MPQYTVAEYAKKVGKTRKTVYNWLSANTLPKGAKAKLCCGKQVITAK